MVGSSQIRIDLSSSTKKLRGKIPHPSQYPLRYVNQNIIALYRHISVEFKRLIL